MSAAEARNKTQLASVCVFAIGQALPSPDEPGIALTTRIARLKAVKQAILAQKRETAKCLKASQKQLKKVKAALNKLSDEDLAQAAAERQAAAKAAPKAAAYP